MSIDIPNGCGIATWTFRFAPLSKLVSVTSGFRNLTGGTDPNVIAGTLKNLMTAVGRPAVPTRMTVNWSLNDVKVLLRLGSGFLTSGQDLVAINGTGTAASSPTPLFTSWVVTKKTAFAGRHFRGRYYFPGFQLTDANVDVGGAIDPAAVAIETSNQANFLGACTGASLPLVLLHDESSPAAGQANEVTQLIARPVVGVQRRRRNPGA